MQVGFVYSLKGKPTGFPFSLLKDLSADKLPSPAGQTAQLGDLAFAHTPQRDHVPHFDTCVGAQRLHVVQADPPLGDELGRFGAGQTEHPCRHGVQPQGHGCDKTQVIGIMQDVQKEYRYLPEDALLHIADRVGISKAKIYGVATFYENFSLNAKGKYVIKCCNGTACHVRKSDDVQKALWESTGMACPDGCIGGGGQPPACNARKEERYQGIFEADKECALRSSEQNPALDGIYKLLNGRAHELLHIHYPDHNR